MDRVSCGAEHGMHWARGSSCFKRGKSFQLKEEEEKEVEKKKGKWLLQMMSRAWSGTSNHHRFDEYSKFVSHKYDNFPLSRDLLRTKFV